MGIKYWLIQALLMVVNIALVLLIAAALGFDIFVNKHLFVIYTAIAFALLLAENVIWDKIHGNA